MLDRRSRPSVGPSTAPLLPDPRLRRSAASAGHTEAACLLAPTATTAAFVAARRRLLVLSSIGSITAAAWAVVTLANLSPLVGLLPSAVLLMDLLALMITSRRRTVRRAGQLRDQRRAEHLRRLAAPRVVTPPSMPSTSPPVPPIVTVSAPS
ncbi:MAG TPA: hypothetical protein VHN80_14185, partial [Kineosporiaceae bacterium]|nr:hypothetical protein [Kineosporiaceae bacterium]